MSAPRVILSVMHDPTTIVRVVFGRVTPDRGIGLDVLVSGRLTLRSYDPAEVTKWFVDNSKANIDKWKVAYHTSGIQPSDYVLPPKGDVNLNVPYLSQRLNDNDPFSTCNVTSYAMALEYYGARRKYADKFEHFPDELEYFLDENGRSRFAHTDLAWMARQYGMEASFNTDRTFDQIRTELRAGHVVIVSGLFTKAGHIILLRGLSGNNFIVNDPFGNALTRYKDHDGANLTYPYSYMLQTVRTPGRDSKWAHFVYPRA